MKMRKLIELSKGTLNDIDFDFTEKQTSRALNKVKIRWICDEIPIIEYSLKWVM